MNWAIDSLDKRYAEKMKALKTGDTEADHGKADDLLIEILREVGFTDVVEAYEAVDKWYA